MNMNNERVELMNIEQLSCRLTKCSQERAVDKEGD